MSRAIRRPCDRCNGDYLRTTNTRYCSDLCRLLDKTVADGECWRWTASTNRSGYGWFGHGSRVWLAHRFAYTLLRGPIDATLELDHLCRNRWCVNPDHLEPVDHRTNILRGDSPAAHQARQVRCGRGHEFTESNTILRGHQRECRKCRDLRNRERYKRVSA